MDDLAKEREAALGIDLAQFIGQTMTVEIKQRTAAIIAQHVMRWLKEDSEHAAKH